MAERTSERAGPAAHEVFRSLLARAGLTQGRFADLITVNIRTVNRWACGGGDIPRVVTLYLETLAKVEDGR